MSRRHAERPLVQYVPGWNVPQACRLASSGRLTQETSPTGARTAGRAGEDSHGRGHGALVRAREINRRKQRNGLNHTPLTTALFIAVELGKHCSLPTNHGAPLRLASRQSPHLPAHANYGTLSDDCWANRLIMQPSVRYCMGIIRN